jgi:methyl-accepting chemotaxis protein
MTFGFGRSAPVDPKGHPIGRAQQPAAGLLEQARLVAALDAMKRGATAPDWPEGEAGAALKAFSAELDRRGRADLETVVAFAADAANTGACVGWVTHDVRQVAESTSTIAGAVEELANSISELSSMSRTGADDAVAAREETAACLAEMRQAGGSMDAIRDRVEGIAQRIGVLEDAVRQIADMAGTIEAISSQTNLLALNATIEAARAGDAGRGFAVVAQEVKSLSGQTAKATEQIRARIATLMEETDAIKRATAESADAVSAGDATIRATGDKVEAVGRHVSVITSNMHALADVLGQQRAATNEISENVGRIASTASKTRGEIDDALAKLVAAEGAAMAGVDAAASRNVPAYEFVRLGADIAVTRRRLGSILVGLTQPTAEAETFGARLDALAPADLPADLLRARDAVRRESARMLGAVRAQDWDTASSAFQAAEAQFETVRTAAAQAAR